MKISIITATYNSGKTLRDTLESVLKQTYSDIEYIIVDGDSKDNTLDIVKAYDSLFEGRLRWISEKDNGLYDAMNKGLKMATGDVIGILNSDDFYTSNAVLQQVADAMNHPDVDAVYGDIHFVDDSDLTRCVRYYSSKGFKRWKMRLGFMPAHPSFYCKKELYERYGAFNTTFKIAADFENLLRLIFVHRIRIKYLSLDFVTMRIGGISSSGVKSYVVIMKEHLKAFSLNHIYTNIVFLSLRYFVKIFEFFKTK